MRRVRRKGLGSQNYRRPELDQFDALKARRDWSFPYRCDDFDNAGCGGRSLVQKSWGVLPGLKEEQQR
jgi:hypothetical protein